MRHFRLTHGNHKYRVETWNIKKEETETCIIEIHQLEMADRNIREISESNEK